MKFICDTEEDYALVLGENNELITATTLANFGETIASSKAAFDTGIIFNNDSGVIRYRKDGEYSQISYQQAPGIASTKWGEYERDSDATVYSLAHPYKVWVADFHKDLLVGLRHFYAIEPIVDGTEVLYHTPYPNTNCTGYNNTSVGWVCLYRTDNGALTTVQEKVQYAWQRESGLHEPYNNANMSNTDGPRFYNQNGIDLYINPEVWQRKTQEEGTDWTFDSDLLIPIRVDPNNRAREHSNGGELYTFKDATEKPYYPYYFGRLNELQQQFYDSGWNNSSGMKSFDNKTLSKLGLVDPPQGTNPQDILEKFSIVPVNDLDFDSFDHNERVLFSEFVLNSRQECVFCEKFGGSMTLVTPHILSIPTAIHPEFKNAQVSDEFPFMISRNIASDFTHAYDEYYVCDGCVQSGLAYIYPAFNGDQDVGPNFQPKSEIAAFTKKGFGKITSQHSDFSPDEGYTKIYEDNAISEFMDAVISRFVVDVQGMDHPVPETHTINCLHCGGYHYYDLFVEGSDGYVNFEDSNFYGVMATPIAISSYIPYLVVHCPNCSTKLPTLSSYCYDVPSLVILDEYQEYLQKVKDLQTPLLPIEEMNWVFKDQFTESKNIILNDLDPSLGDGKKKQVVQAETLKLHDNFLLQPYDTNKQVKVIDSKEEIPQNQIIYKESLFDKLYAPKNMLAGFLNVSGVQTLVVVSAEHEAAIKDQICACGIIVPHDDLSTISSIADLDDSTNACKSCVKLNDNGDFCYKPIFIQSSLSDSTEPTNT